MRFRYTYMIIGTILALALALLADPDLRLITNLTFGASTLVGLIILSKAVLYVGVLHLSRKALLDYLDLEDLFRRAKQSPEGAGSAIIGVGLIFIALAITIYAATVI